jgi:excisionase family DNA binding protein
MDPYAARTSSRAPERQDSKPPSPALPMLTPTNAWHLLCRRTGGSISRSTFYRWLNSGRIGATRVGYRFLIPLPLLEEVIQECLDGKRV